MIRPRTTESLMLYIQYLSVLGIWFAIPSVTLLLTKDKRWPYAVIILSITVSLLTIAYIVQWSALFPRSAVEITEGKQDIM